MNEQNDYIKTADSTTLYYRALVDIGNEIHWGLLEWDNSQNRDTVTSKLDLCSFMFHHRRPGAGECFQTVSQENREKILEDIREMFQNDMNLEKLASVERFMNE